MGLTRVSDVDQPEERAETAHAVRALAGEVRRMREEVKASREETEALRSQVSRLQKRFSQVLLSRDEAAERLGVSTRTLLRWRKEGKITPVEGVPGVRYHPDVVADLAG
jgi:DNA-binding transcriptional regulator YiaG